MYIIINENDFNKQYKGHGYYTTDLQLLVDIVEGKRDFKVVTETDLMNDLDLTQEETIYVIYNSTVYILTKQPNKKYTIYTKHQVFTTNYEDITNIFEYLENNI